MNPSIDEMDLEGGDKVLATELPVAPFGTAYFAAPDASSDSREILNELIHHWSELWPEMLDRLLSDMQSYGVEQKLGSDEFIGSISRMDANCYMGDKSDYLLRLDFEEAPFWDYFLRNGEIVHFQPVF